MASDTLETSNSRNWLTSFLFPSVVISTFLLYWLVGMPILWTVFYFYSKLHDWHPHWHIYYWICALFLWFIFMVILLIHIVKRRNKKQNEEVKIIQNRLLKKRNDSLKEYELSVLHDVKEVTPKVSDTGVYKKQLNTERSSKVEEQKSLTLDLSKSYSSVNDSKNQILNTQSSKAKQILGYEHDLQSKKLNKLSEKVDKNIAIYSPSKDLFSFKYEKRKTFHFTTDKKTNVQPVTGDLNRFSFPYPKNVNQPLDSNPSSSPKETANMPVLNREDSYKGLPKMEKFDSYLKLVTVDTPHSPREVFFSDLIAAADEEEKRKSILVNTSTSDKEDDEKNENKRDDDDEEDVFSDFKNLDEGASSPTTEYFVADIRPRPRSITTEAFIIIDTKAEQNKRVSKAFVVEDKQVKE